MTTPELIAQIAMYQSNAAQLQAMLDARMAAASDTGILRLSAVKAFGLQGTDPAHVATWNAEQAAYPNDPSALWVQPEHAYWLRLAKDAITAGVMDPAI